MATIEAETINETALINRDEAAPVARGGNYEPVRFSAMKHGILSKLTVLAHEDRAEFDELLAALIDEHRPAGMTERHLIEELATIIWRKRRVLLAEGAAINRGLKAVVSSGASSSISAAAPFERGLSGQEDDVRRAMLFSPERVAEEQGDAEGELRGLWRAQSALRKVGPNAYAKALRALRGQSRDAWDSHVADGTMQPDAASLDGFLRDILEPVLSGMAKKACHQSAIKVQIVGDGLQAHKLEPLNRYEVHLDRKFERTLAMLLKLKGMRGA